MPKLIYFTIASLDGHIEDESGRFGWAAPDDEVHAFVNDLVRPAGTFLYGRRMYEGRASGRLWWDFRLSRLSGGACRSRTRGA